MTGTKVKIIFIVCCIIGIVLIAAGCALIPVFKWIITNKINDNVVLTNGSQGYKAWDAPPVPIYLEVRLFNVVNKDEILRNGSKPIVEEMGPYVYLEHPNKKNIEFEQNDTLIRYFQKKIYTFMPNMSAGSENDHVVMLNFPIISLATEVQYIYGIQTILKYFLKSQSEGIFMNRTVKEVLWGYEDPAMTKLKKIVPKSFNIPDKFGLLYMDPGSNYTIHTGKDNIKELNNVKSWDKKESLPFWGSKYANQINGTDGTLFHPSVNKDELLYIFSNDVCRSIFTEYQKTINVKGIELYEFTLPSSVLASATENPDNAAFCTPYPTACLGTGVLNISTCMQGAPLVMSLPHFYLADSNYVKAVIGMKPEKEKHETVLNVEPITGAVMNAAKRLQFNMFVKNLFPLPDTSKVENIIFPLFWVVETGSLTDELAEQFRSQVYWSIDLSQSVQWGLLGLGVVVLIIAVIVVAVRRFRQNGPGLSIQADVDDDTVGIIKHGDA